jgi:hypothetical protein
MAKLIAQLFKKVELALEEVRTIKEDNWKRLEALQNHIEILNARAEGKPIPVRPWHPVLIIMDGCKVLITIEEDYVSSGERGEEGVFVIDKSCIGNVICGPETHSGAWAISYITDNRIVRKVVYFGKEEAEKQFNKLKQVGIGKI